MNTTRLAWGAKVPPAFRQRVFDVCYRLGWDGDHPDWLMACMAFESGGTFSPSIYNAAGSGAVGLIQFMPSTAWGLGTTISELASMSQVAQLGYVQAYFKPYAARIKSLSDMYMAILMPRYIGQPDTAVLFNKGTVAYRQNSALDANTDGKITKAEATAKVAARLTRGLLAGYVWEQAA